MEGEHGPTNAEGGFLGRIPAGREGRHLLRLEKALYRRRLLRPPRHRLPHFLIAGAMKAGSTWLYENLRRHPGIFLPDPKELYFFSHRFHTETMRAYTGMFAGAEHLRRGEATPDYYCLPAARIRFIRAVMPEVKTIFIVRHPVDRAWSEAHMMCVGKAGRRLEDVSDETFIRYIESPPARKRSDQVRALDNWRRIFPEDQLFVSAFDTIAARPKALLESLFGFLGVGTDIPWQSLPYADRVIPVYEPGGYVYGGRAEEVALRRGPPPMPEGVRRHLEDRLAGQLAGLTERLGDQVSHWSAGRSSADRQMPVRAGLTSARSAGAASAGPALVKGLR